MQRRVGGLILLLATLGLLGMALVTGFTVSWSTPAIQDARAEQLRAETQAYVVRQDQEATLHNEVQGALVTAWRVAYIGLGLAVAITAIGLALAVTRWAHTRAAMIYPNAAGQLPMMRVGGWGWSGLVDPNRAATAQTLFQAPTVLDIAADVWARVRGRATVLPIPWVSQPLALSESAHLQLGAQASAVAMVASSTRHPAGAAGLRSADIQRTAEVMVSRAVSQVPSIPEITMMDDTAEVDRLLAEHAGQMVDA